MIYSSQVSSLEEGKLGVHEPGCLEISVRSCIRFC